MKAKNTALALTALTFLLPAAAQAYVISSSSTIPPALPGTGVIGYHFSGSVPAFNFPPAPPAIPIPFTITIDTAILRTLGPVNVVPSGADEIASFSTNMDAVGDVIPIANDLPSAPTGPGSILTVGRGGNITGTFQTEFLSLNLTGSSPLGAFLIRESPTLASLGQASVQDLGGGQFRIDSFFDVFLEMSVDGGATWSPNINGATRLTLLPEPGSFMLAGLTGAMLLRRRRNAP